MDDTDNEQVATSVQKDKGQVSEKRSRFVTTTDKNCDHLTLYRQLCEQKNVQSSAKYTNPVKIIYTRLAKKAVDSGCIFNLP